MAEKMEGRAYESLTIHHSLYSRVCWPFTLVWSTETGQATMLYPRYGTFSPPAPGLTGWRSKASSSGESGVCSAT
jgi:hypothetical protein